MEDVGPPSRLPAVSRPDVSANQQENRSNDADIFFPFAPQPDIVRASQKDEYYKKFLYEKYFDLVRYYFGALQN